MRKLNQLFLVLFLSLPIIFTSCEDEKGPTPTPVDPTATVFARGTTDNQGRPEVRITDNGNGIGNYTFDADSTYVLENFVFVNDGQTLTIEAGSIIKGESGTGENATALIVARGGTINANGTSGNPIIFTSVVDDTSNPSDLTSTTRGLWGSLIVLGNASTNWPANASIDGGNATNAAGTFQIEGIPTTEPRGLYGGGPNGMDTESSGTLRYVSIRHGGSEIGAGNEINGLTLGGVGSGTTVEYIETFANADDGYEWFGGTVNCKYLISAFCADEMFDWDAGWQGSMQFALGVHAADAGGFSFESNGVDSGQASTTQGNDPKSLPFVVNGTFIAFGASEGLRVRDGSGAFFHNNIWYGFKSGDDGVVIDSNNGTNTEASGKRLDDNELVFKANRFINFVGGTDLASILQSGTDPETASALSGTLDGNNSTDNAYSSTNPFNGLDISGNNGFDPTLTNTTFVTPNFTVETTAPTTAAGTLDATPTFIGAFGASNWATGWSALSVYDIF